MSLQRQPQTPSELYRLIWQDDAEGVRASLKNGADPNAKDNDGRTPLMEAVVRGTDAMVDLLIEGGADLNIQDHGGFSALHFAAQQFRLVAAEALLRGGAKIDLRDNHSNTPLWRALFNSQGRGDIIRLLLNNGANPHSKNNHGKSCIDLANMVANYDLKQFFSKDSEV